MRSISGAPMIELVLKRLASAKLVDAVILATSVDAVNDSLAAHVQLIGFPVFRGSEHDVLNRYFQAAVAHSADIVVRITADCPLVDPQLVDEAIEAFRAQGLDYLSNVVPPTFPDGLDIEVFSFAALERAAHEATTSHDREHVTPYLRSGKFVTSNLAHEEDLSDLRWTVDEAADLEIIRGVYKHFEPETNFGWRDVLQLWQCDPGLFSLNTSITRNAGAEMSSGQKLWQRAKHVIPGGNMLLSKRPEMFLPERWPIYFSKSKGCRVWDLDGREFIDMNLMGVGTNTLGYGHDEVDAAVRAVIDAGNMSTLNCPEEVELSERLVALHPWADMVRLARSGGEANAIAIRIARASVGRDDVAVCGYHGWHDWYLSANLGADDSLAGHLLPGLDPAGVPKALRGVVHPFDYNDFAALEALVAQHNIGVIKMEVSRNAGPQDGFLQNVRKLADDKGIVLIFDECTSGFRETFGGLHKKYGVEPDMAVFGKALGNGYAITAILGRRSIMEAAQSTFISSTFWTERIGPAAAVRTLDVMERQCSWERITNTGKDIQRRWQDLADTHGLPIDQSGLPALAGFRVRSPHALAYKTLISQEMLGKGYLAGTSIYISLAHTAEIVDGYFAALDPIFGLIKQCEDGLDVNSLLTGPVCHDGFKRLN